MKKEFRIKKNHEIASIVSKRKKVSNNNYILYYQQTSEEKIRVAISVSKKYGHAFERNKAKRITRNILRPYLKTMKNVDFVVVIKSTLKETPYEKLENEMRFLMKLVKNKTQGEKKWKKQKEESYFLLRL